MPCRANLNVLHFCTFSWKSARLNSSSVFQTMDWATAQTKEQYFKGIYPTRSCTIIIRFSSRFQDDQLNGGNTTCELRFFKHRADLFQQQGSWRWSRVSYSSVIKAIINHHLSCSRSLWLASASFFEWGDHEKKGMSHNFFLRNIQLSHEWGLNSPRC